MSGSPPEQRVDFRAAARERREAKIAAVPWVIALAFLVFPSCASRNLHPELKADPKVLLREWILPTHGPFKAGDRGYEYSNPVIHENTLVFGNQSQGLVSLYPTLSQIRWTLPIPGGVVSEIAIEKNLAYFGGGDGFLYAVSLENGRVAWRYDLHNPVVSRPTLSGGRVFVTSTDDTIYAFDAGTGKWLWHYRRKTSPPSTIHGASSPLVDGGEVIAGLSDGFIVAVNVNDGQLKWEKKIHQGLKFADVDATPILDSGVLYIASYDGALYAIKRKSGDILWRVDTGGSKAVFVDEHRIYFPASNGTVFALQKESGQTIWKFDLDGGTPTALVVAGELVIFGSTERYLYALDKSTGEGRYRFDVGYDSGFSGSPAFDSVNQKLYFLSGAGNLMSFAVTRPPRKKLWLGSTEPYSNAAF